MSIRRITTMLLMMFIIIDPNLSAYQNTLQDTLAMPTVFQTPEKYRGIITEVLNESLPERPLTTSDLVKLILRLPVNVVRGKIEGLVGTRFVEDHGRIGVVKSVEHAGELVRRGYEVLEGRLERGVRGGGRDGDSQG